MKILTFTGIGTRHRQEDSCGVVQNPVIDATIAIVADGMGGHEHGDEASRNVVEAISAYWSEVCDIADCESLIAKSVAYAGEVYERKAEGREMGSTLVMAVVKGAKAYIAHCGDSRAYVVQRSANRYFHTNDHTVYSEFGYELVANAFFTDMCSEVKPEVREIECQSGDRIMVCTDGVFKFIPADELRKVLTSDQSLDGVAEDLEAYCMAMSGDNYTAILIEF